MGEDPQDFLTVEEAAEVLHIGRPDHVAPAAPLTLHMLQGEIADEADITPMSRGHLRNAREA